MVKVELHIDHVVKESETIPYYDRKEVWKITQNMRHKRQRFYNYFSWEITVTIQSSINQDEQTIKQAS